MKKHLWMTALALVVAWLPAYAQAQGLTVLAYNDGYPGLQDAYLEYVNEVTSDGVSTVKTLSDVGEFSDQLNAGRADVYAAFSENLQLLKTWKTMIPAGKQYIYFSIDPNTDQLVGEYALSNPAGVGLLRVGEVTTYQGGVPLSSSQYNTQDGTPTEPPKTGEARNEIPDKAWDWLDGLVKGLQKIIDKMVTKAVCMAACAQGCLDTLLNELPQDMIVTITAGADTTPPNFGFSVSVQGTVAQQKKAAKAMAKFTVCQGQCLAQCF